MKQKKLILTLFTLLGFITLTTAQIPSYVPVNGLYAWWSFNNTGNDLSVNSNHFTNYNLPFTTDRFNNPGSAVEGNGTTQYMQCNTPSFSLGANSTFTISFWMLKTSMTGGVALMHGTTAAGNFIWNFQTNTTGALMFGTNKQQSAWIWTQTTYSLNTWEHYVATYNNGAITLYKNGTVAATNSFTHTAVTQSVLPIWLSRGVSGSYFAGKLDDIGMWNRVLTQQEINNLFTSGCSPTFSTVVMTACDSYTWPLNNQTYTQTGTYNDTLMNYLGCDSIVTLDLTINNSTYATVVETECDSFTWINGITYTSSVDTVTYIIPNAAGCDSIITLDLTIVNLHFTQQPTDVQAHTGSNTQFDVSASPAGATFQWQTNTGSGFQDLTDIGQYSGTQTSTLIITYIDVLNHMQQYRCIANIGNCADTSDIATITVPDIGIEETNGTTLFNVFPNPATGYIYLKADVVLIGTTFTLVDQSGRVAVSGIIESELTKISLGGLPHGNYMLIASNRKNQAFRIVL